MKLLTRAVAALCAAASLFAGLPAAAQALPIDTTSFYIPAFGLCFGTFKGTAQCVDALHPLPVNATVTANVAAATPFLQAGSDTLPMTTASARRALPSADIVALFYNPSTNAAAHVKLGNGSVTAALTDQTVAPGTYFAVPNPGGVNTNYAAILESGTGNISLWTGTGQLQAVGGGGGGTSGGLTDTQLRATPVPISGTVTATGPLTDTQLRATPVPVSGTVTATGPITDTQLRATPVPVAITSGGGTLSAKANAASQTSTEAATTDPISMDLHRSLRVLNMDSSGNPLDPAAATPSGENHTGEVGGNQQAIQITPTGQTATTYTTGQAVGGLHTVTNAERVAGKGGLIQSTVIALKVANTVSIDVFYFNANPTGSTCTSASAFVLAAADIGKVVAVAHVTDWTAGNTASIGQSQNMAAPFVLPSGTSLFACDVARGSIVTGTSTDLTETTNVIRN